VSVSGVKPPNFPLDLPLTMHEAAVDGVFAPICDAD